MAAVAKQTTEAFDWKLIVSYKEVEFTETSLMANPWYELRGHQYPEFYKSS